MTVSFKKIKKIQLIMAEWLHLTSFLAWKFVGAALWFNSSVNEGHQQHSKLDLTEPWFLILSAHYADNDGDVINMMATYRSTASWIHMAHAIHLFHFTAGTKDEGRCTFTYKRQLNLSLRGWANNAQWAGTFLTVAPTRCVRHLV